MSIFLAMRLEAEAGRPIGPVTHAQPLTPEAAAEMHILLFTPWERPILDPPLFPPCSKAHQRNKNYSDFSVRKKPDGLYRKCNVCGRLASEPIEEHLAPLHADAPAGWSRGPNPEGDSTE